MIYAEKMNYVIKLLATCQKQDGSVFARVSPMMISKEHPLAMVNDVFNAIFVKGNVIGDVMFYGKGAGKLPTASAVVADIVDAAKHSGTNIITFWSREKIDLKDKDEVKVSYFIRVQDEDGLAENKVKEAFKEIQPVEALSREYAFITEVMTEGEFAKRLGKLSDLTIMSKVRTEK